MPRRALPLLLLALFPLQLDAQKKAPDKGSPEESLASVQVEKGLKVEVWAAEPLLQNPVAFCFDERGAAYVAETNRLHTGTPDTRNFMKWLDEDLAARTVADRLAMYKKHGFGPFPNNDDLVRKVWDSTGSGKADQSSVYSSGYNRPEDGLGAGVLARKGKVYYTNIPDLYVLEDTTGDNKADKKSTLFTGFGLAVQFVGHDLHGLRMGPDGKLYFTIGDRGFNVKTKEGKQLSYPNQGAVLRCDLDGKNLEVVHHGLRNPQEIAFDDYGNLFTYDNNCDAGDRARWVYVVEGGDSGWRGGYQYDTLYAPPGTPQNNRGPWHADKIWHLPTKDSGPPAYVVPPIAHLGNGPSGITHYPGIGLADKYHDHFFACDFTASPGNSVIWDVSLKPKGAGFEFREAKPFVRGIVPTDCEFGPDGAFYWSDWVGGWGHPNKGRIFRLTDPEAMKNPAVAEAKQLLAEGMEKRTTAELAKLLEHPHQQVRMEAQFELASVASDRRKPADSIAAFQKVAKDSKNRLARLHAIWGLGMILRSDRGSVDDLLQFTADADAEVRAQAVKTLGCSAGPAAGTIQAVEKLHNDPEPRVRFHAAIARGLIGEPDVGRIFPGSDDAVYGPYFALLKSNNDADPYLRHGAVVGLAELAKNHVDLFNAWSQSKDKYDTPAVRLGVVLALRRHKSDKLAEFLTDSDPKTAAEAAMAVYDERVRSAYSKLADLADRNGLANAISYRAIAANYIIGGKPQAERVAKIATRADVPDHLRVFALKLLAAWSHPPRRDPITGLIQDLPPRGESLAADALTPMIAGAFIGSDAVRNEAVKTSSKLGVKEVGPLLMTIVKDASASPGSRADALVALAAIKDTGRAEAVEFARKSDQPKLRAAGLKLFADREPSAAFPEIKDLLANEKASVPEKQAAFAALAAFPESTEADELLAEWLKHAATRTAEPELLLDIVEAAETRTKTRGLKLHAPLAEGIQAFN